MKKIILSAALCAVMFGVGAAELAVSSKSTETTPTQECAKETILYDGPAYSVGETGLYPKAGDSVNVYWTDSGCTVNGTAASTPGEVSGGGFPIAVNGKVKYMTYYVMYRGERYFFQR